VVGAGSEYFGGVEYHDGYLVSGSVGYDFGVWRTEFEVAYRRNDIDCTTQDRTGDVCADNLQPGAGWQLSQMFNVLYDVPVADRIEASVGAGIGGVLVVSNQSMINYAGDSPELDDYVLAGQLLAQVGYRISDRWQAYAGYHYMLADDPESFSPSAGSTANWELSNHSVQLGLRFDLQRDGAMPERPRETGGAPKQFIVFFGFNKSNLTAEAARVVTEAAAAAKKYGSASISVVGHTDTVGSNDYNMRLSMRRSQAVKDGLIANGIGADMISTGGRGEAELMVQTGDSVKEPQNRRATIDLK
jgi:OOP family OmpA-OmpF porin